MLCLKGSSCETGYGARPKMPIFKIDVSWFGGLTVGAVFDCAGRCLQGSEQGADFGFCFG